MIQPNPNATLGSNTQKFFDQLPEPVEQALDPLSFREDVAVWDRDYAFSYPTHIPATAFKEENIAGVAASIYRSPHADALTPTILLLQGGGFFCELKNVHMSLLANIAAKIDCHLILPHYSLAPGVKLPQVIDEVSDVLQTLLTTPEAYGVTQNLVLIGYSAGGNLAWNAILNVLNSPDTRKLTEQISQVILISPFVDLSVLTTKNSPYQDQQNKDKMLQTWSLEQIAGWTLPSNADGTEPVYSPVYQSSSKMKGMPPTTIIAGELERLLGDAVKTAEVLKSADVPTRLVILEGQAHNHSCHSLIRDGVFTADLIATMMRGESIENMKGEDGLGVKVY